MPSDLRLFGREYCSLCHTMRDQLQAQGVSALWCDVDEVDEWEELYGDLVPALVTESGQILCHYHLDQVALDAYLAEFR